MNHTHDPTCTECGKHHSEHEGQQLQLGEPHTFPDCSDCGAEVDEDHDPRCSVVLDDIADQAHERMKDDKIIDKLERGEKTT